MCRYETILKIFSAYVLAVLEFGKEEYIGDFHFLEGGG
jgi:hypothetical protein